MYRSNAYKDPKPPEEKVIGPLEAIAELRVSSLAARKMANSILQHMEPTKSFRIVMEPDIPTIASNDNNVGGEIAV